MSLHVLVRMLILRRYSFRPNPSNDIVDLTEDTPFYFNAYSGELSLEFPRAERKFKGGILAYVLTKPSHVSMTEFFAGMVRCFSRSVHRSYLTDMISVARRKSV